MQPFTENSYGTTNFLHNILSLEIVSEIGSHLRYGHTVEKEHLHDESNETNNSREVDKYDLICDQLNPAPLFIVMLRISSIHFSSLNTKNTTLRKGCFQTDSSASCV